MAGSDHCLSLLKLIWRLRKLILFIIAPVLLYPLITNVGGELGKCSYATGIMVIFWIFEVLPVSVTSLLPVPLLSMLGLAKVSDISKEYTKDIIVLILSAFFVAAAMEKCNLHKRMAVRILMIFGTRPEWLLLGVLSSSFFFSMWLSGAVVAAMLVPIVINIMRKCGEQSTLEQVGDNSLSEVQNISSCDEEAVTENEKTFTKDTINEDRKLNTSMHLAIAYGANIGACASLTGGSANFAMVTVTDEFFEKYGLSSGVTFGTWMAFGLPLAVCCVIFTWIWLQLLFLPDRGIRTCFRRKGTPSKQSRDILREEYRKLGPTTYPEVVVLVVFVLMILLFLTKRINYTFGWEQLFKKGYTGYSVPAVLLMTSLFVIPSRPLPEVIRNLWSKGVHFKVTPVLSWDFAKNKTPWGVILLLGGSFALVSAIQKSGLSFLIGEELSKMTYMEGWQLVLVITAVTSILTEFTSITSTVILMMPILGELAIKLGLHPLYLMFPGAMAARFAFMMPIATASNSVVFSAGSLHIKTMVLTGFFVNIICVLVLNVATVSWGSAIFNWNTIPDVLRSNITSPSAVNNTLSVEFK